jgi:hypothetical protein
VYNNWARIKGETKSIVKWEENNADLKTIEFRDSKYSQQSTMFRSDKMCGKVEVIAVPYIRGNHVCSTVKEALYLTLFLKSMHTSGLVHGDIRGLNIVFAGDRTSLIDHDYGGLVEKALYPPGYVTSLPDGSRVGAKAAAPITKERDAKALAHVLVHLHKVKSTEIADVRLQWLELDGMTSLGNMEALLRAVGENVAVTAAVEFADFMNIYRSKQAQSKKQTLEGDAATPEKTVTLPSKRGRDS